MKTIYLCSLLFVSIAGYGQTFDFYKRALINCSPGVIDNTGEKTRSITLDIKNCKGIFGYSREVAKNRSGIIDNNSFTFTVININTLKYDVLIDNKVVNYNLEIPDLFETNMKSPTVGTSMNLIKSELTDNELLSQLLDEYKKLQTCQEFYTLLVELADSNSSLQNMITNKREYFCFFIQEVPKSDGVDVARIFDYYSSIIMNISVLKNDFTGDLFKKNPEKKKTLDDVSAYAKKVDSLEIPKKLASLYGAINDQAFTVYSFIPKPDGDQLTVTIRAKPKSAYENNNKEIEIEIPFSVMGGWKIDFSAGMFLSNLADKKYVNKPNYVRDTITGYYLVADDNPASYGLAGYLHAYRRSGTSFNYGFALGTGIDQDKQIKIMPGLSLIFGEKERFIINAGMVIGKRKTLSKELDDSRMYKVITEPVYAEPFKIGCFVGVSYNLSN